MNYLLFSRSFIRKHQKNKTPPISTLLIPAASSIHYPSIHLKSSLQPVPNRAHEKPHTFLPRLCRIVNATSLHGGIASLDHRLRAVNPPGSAVASRRDGSD
jgi:hypothetical protein